MNVPIDVASSLRPLTAAVAHAALQAAPRIAPVWAGRAVGALGAVAVTLAVAAHTGRSPHAPRRDIVSGRASPKTTAGGTAERWTSDRVLVTLDPSLTAIGGHARDAVERGFDAWYDSGARLPTLAFELSPSPLGTVPAQDGVNSVVYAPIPFAGHTEDLAITVGYSDDAGEIIEADIIVNSRHHFRILDDDDHESEDDVPSCSGNPIRGCGNAFDLRSVVTHEVGHFFGLGEDRTDGLATMFACTSPCETHKRDLDSSDQGAIDSLYAGATDSPSAQASTGCAVRPGASAASGFALAGMIGAFAACRRLRRR